MNSIGICKYLGLGVEASRIQTLYRVRDLASIGEYSIESYIEPENTTVLNHILNQGKTWYGSVCL